VAGGLVRFTEQLTLETIRTNVCEVSFSAFLATEDDVLATIPETPAVTLQAPEQ
jgi:hypothetical protein